MLHFYKAPVCRSLVFFVLLRNNKLVFLLSVPGTFSLAKLSLTNNNGAAEELVCSIALFTVYKHKNMPCTKSLTVDALLLPATVLYAVLLLSGCSPGDNNSAPLPEDDRFQIKNGETRNFLPDDLLGNDRDPDGDTLKLISVSSPAHGTLTSLPGGGYRYVNDGSNSSNDSFGYQVEDDNGGRASATVTLEVTLGPTANDDSQQTDEDIPVFIDVVANDTVGGNGSVQIATSDGSLVVTSGPANGSTIVTAGKVQYIPDADFNGSDSFTYTIKDSSGIPSNPATVTIAVSPVNDAPLANDDNRSTPEDTPVTIDVLANDTDADGDIDADTISIVTPPASGSAVVSDGKVIYTPSSNYSGTDSFRYTIQDSSDVTSNIATVTVTVTGVNDAPVAVNDSASSGKNSPIDIAILNNDSDPDGNSTIATVTVTRQPTSGSATVNADKSIRYEPVANYTGTVTFEYQLKDDMGQSSNIATVTVTISNVGPVATGSCSTTKQEIPITGLLGASDPDAGEILSFALGSNGSSGTGPMNTANGGTVEITNPSTGAYTYTPRPSKGGRGRDTFAYQVTDGSGATSSATETVIVDLKIMPVGDSITSGQTDVGNGGVPSVPLRKGYRQLLQEKLSSYGYGFDFVGGLNHGCQASPDYDEDGEGWPGYTAQQISEGNGIPIKLCNGQTAPTYTGIWDALNDNPADIILLHIGTNDVGSTNGDDIAAILDDIDLWEGSTNGNPVTVILARIIDSWKVTGGGTDPAVTTLNNDIDTMVQSRTNDDVILVDMHGALNYPDDIGDFNQTNGYRLHPVDSGYEKMADVWLYPLIHEGTDKVTAGASGVLMDKCP